VREVLERTEMILQELDRRIEGVSARGSERMNAIEEQMIALRQELSTLRQLSGPQLADVDARARAEVPEIPSADRADAEHAEDPEHGQPAGPDEPEAPANGARPAESDAATGNGHVAAQAPAASAAE
jgi:hypothetical protein